jgi:hypothetical protein
MFVPHHENSDRLPISNSQDQTMTASSGRRMSATDLALEHDLDSTDPLAVLVEGLDNP